MFKIPTTNILYALYLHDALPIWRINRRRCSSLGRSDGHAPARENASFLKGRKGERDVFERQQSPQIARRCSPRYVGGDHRSEEHTSELQSRPHLVCRLLLEKKKT